MLRNFDDVRKKATGRGGDPLKLLADTEPANPHVSTVAGYVDRMAGLIVLQNDVVETAHRLMDSREWETVQRLQSELWARIARLRKFEIANQLSVNDFKKHVGY